METPIKNAYWKLVGSKLSKDNEGFENCFFMGAAWMTGVIHSSLNDAERSKKLVTAAAREILSSIEGKENEI